QALLMHSPKIFFSYQIQYSSFFAKDQKMKYSNGHVSSVIVIAKFHTVCFGGLHFASACLDRPARMAHSQNAPRQGRQVARRKFFGIAEKSGKAEFFPARGDTIF